MDLNSELLAFVRALPLGCWLKDASGRHRFLSAASAGLFGPFDGDGVGKTAHELFPAALADDLVEGDRRVVEASEVATTPIWVSDGAAGRRQLVIVKFPVQTTSGTLLGGVGIDITSFSSAGGEASSYRQILDAINDLVLVKGPRSKVRWANKAFLAAYGMSIEQLQGLVDAPFVEPDLTLQYVKDDQVVFTTGRVLDVAEEAMSWADGSSRTVHTVKSPIFDSAGQVSLSVAVIRDITDRKRLELDLRQAQKLESIGRLAAGMAHEINTPIQFMGDQATFAREAVCDLLELCAQYRKLLEKVEAGVASPADAAEVREAEGLADLDYLRQNVPPAFDAILDGAQQVGRLVQAMKVFGHPDAGSKQATDINAALRNALMITTNEYRHVADVDLDLGELPPVLCNASELNQVFLNLIINASHAIADRTTTAGGRGRLGIRTRLDGDDAVIEISDTGSGIPEKIRSLVFDPFFTTKAVGQGTGQGLAIARSIVVDKHHGKLTFTTESGRGTTFSVRLPVAPDAPLA